MDYFPNILRDIPLNYFHSIAQITWSVIFLYHLKEKIYRTEVEQKTWKNFFFSFTISLNLK